MALIISMPLKYELTSRIIAGPILLILVRLSRETLDYIKFMQNPLVGRIIDLGIRPFTIIISLQYGQEVTLLLMGESKINLILLLYLIFHDSWKFTTGRHMNIVLSKLIVPDNPILLVTLLTIINFRGKEVRYIGHPPHSLHIMKGTYLVGGIFFLMYLMCSLKTLLFYPHINLLS